MGMDMCVFCMCILYVYVYVYVYVSVHVLYLWTCVFAHIFKYYKPLSHPPIPFVTAQCQRLEFEMKAAQDKTKAVEEQSSKYVAPL
ncbi:hypothetical protein EON63_24970 [archaeon]|nr:MAG: hypothetical protein EON63_24970 [archaeon]